MGTIDLEARRKKIELFAKLGVFTVVCGAVGSYAYLILEGLIALAAVGGSAILAWGLAPAVATFVANKRIELLKAAIEANPIETMQNIYTEKVGELQAQSQAIATVDTQYRNVQSLIDNLPPKLKAKAASYQELANKIKAGEDQMKAKYNFAQTKLNEYKDHMEEAQSLWEVALALKKAIAVSQKARMDTFREIKEKVAFDTVTVGLNSAFAELDETIRVNQIEDGMTESTPEAPKAITPGEAGIDIIDLGSVKAGTKVRVNG